MTQRGFSRAQWSAVWAWLALLPAIILPLPLAAATITVTTYSDELNPNGRCSLREAIRAVNTRASVDSCPPGDGNDTILLAAGTYRLTLVGADEDDGATGDLDINPGTEDPYTEDLNTANPNTANSTLTILGTGATATAIDGGALDRVLQVINPDVTLHLADLTIRNGQVTDGYGAGVLNRGTLILERVILSGNVVNGSDGQAVGGGLCNACGSATGQAMVRSTIFSNNRAQRGGGIFSEGVLTVSASSLISNTAVLGSALELHNHGLIINSTFTGNQAEEAGAIVKDGPGTLHIRFSTITNNRATQEAGLLFFSGAGLLQVDNTILATNGQGNCRHGVLPIASLGYNLVSDATCGFRAAGDRTHIFPRLGPLHDNGGPTPTRALRPDSPAVNAANRAMCPGNDQRNVTRPQGRGCDIGAYEASFHSIYFPMVRRH